MSHISKGHKLLTMFLRNRLYFQIPTHYKGPWHKISHPWCLRKASYPPHWLTLMSWIMWRNLSTTSNSHPPPLPLKESQISNSHASLTSGTACKMGKEMLKAPFPHYLSFQKLTILPSPIENTILLFKKVSQLFFPKLYAKPHPYFLSMPSPPSSTSNQLWTIFSQGLSLSSKKHQFHLHKSAILSVERHLAPKSTLIHANNCLLNKMRIPLQCSPTHIDFLRITMHKYYHEYYALVFSFFLSRANHAQVCFFMVSIYFLCRFWRDWNQIEI